MNKQPFYHRTVILFTGTKDVSAQINAPEFAAALGKWLKHKLGPRYLRRPVRSMSVMLRRAIRTT